MATGSLMAMEDPASINGDFQEKIVQVLTPSHQATPPQLSDANDQAETDMSKCTVIGSESAEAEDGDVVLSKQPTDIDLQISFYPHHLMLSAWMNSKRK